MSQCVWQYSWSRARNLHEFIDSTAGVVLAPEVQPGPHQVLGTVNRTDGLFAIPAEARSLFYSQVCWNNGDKVTCSRL